MAFSNTSCHVVTDTLIIVLGAHESSLITRSLQSLFNLCMALFGGTDRLQRGAVIAKGHYSDVGVRLG